MVFTLLGKTVSSIVGSDVTGRELGRMECIALGVALFTTDGLEVYSALGRPDGLRIGKAVG